MLHVGTHKTGTTALQKTLLSQHSDLIGAGVLYPLGVLKPGYVAHHPFARALLSEKFRSEFPRILQKLDAERAEAGVPNVLISSELLESISRDPERIQYLNDCLHSCFSDIFVVAVTRAAESYFLSLYKELSRVRTLSWNFSEMLSPYLRDKRVSVDYPKINVTIHHEFSYELFASNFLRVFGRDSILFMEYETLYMEGEGDIIGPLIRKLSEFFSLSAMYDFSVRLKTGMWVNRSKPLWKAAFQYALNRYQWQGAELRLAEVIHGAFGRHSLESAAVFGAEKHAEAILRSVHGMNGDLSVIAAAQESHRKLLRAEALIDYLARSMCSAAATIEPYPEDSVQNRLTP